MTQGSTLRVLCITGEFYTCHSATWKPQISGIYSDYIVTSLSFTELNKEIAQEWTMCERKLLPF